MIPGNLWEVRVIPKVQTRVVQIRESVSQNRSWETASLVFQKPLKSHECFSFAKSGHVEKEIPVKMERARLVSIFSICEKSELHKKQASSWVVSLASCTGCERCNGA